MSTVSVEKVRETMADVTALNSVTLFTLGPFAVTAFVSRLANGSVCRAIQFQWVRAK